MSNVATRIHAVLAELDGIGKNQMMQGGSAHYAYRGIEDLTKTLNPLFSKHGIFFVPYAREHHEESFETSNGKSMRSTYIDRKSVV